MISFDEFRQRHPNGSRIADPLLIGNGETETTMYQCVSLIKQYWVECYGITVNWPGNAIDLWTHTNAIILTKFSRVGGNDAQKGDIVVFNGLAGNPFGHVGIATGVIDGVNVEILEQNGATGGGTGTGGDAIRTRAVSRSRIAGLLRPIQVTPNPQPVAPAAANVGYTPLSQNVTVTTPTLQVRSEPHLNAPVHQANTPDGAVHQGNVVAVTGWTYGDSVNNNTIWLRSVAGHWFWSGGTDFNLAQVLPVAAPAPVAAPTPPPPPPVLPAAPLPIPTSTEPYHVVKTIKGYLTSTAAANDTDARSTVEEGTYYVYNRRYNVAGTELLALNVTKLLGKPGTWINPHDNVPDPVPQPKAEPVTTPTIWPHSPKQEAAMPVVPTEPDWRTTYVAFKDAQGNPQPRDYIAMNELKVVDYETKRPDQPWHLYLSSKISGTFIKDGVKIARPKYFADKYLWFGVPEIDPSTGLLNIEPYEQVYSTTTTAPERKVLHAQTTVDHIAEIKSILEKDFQRVFDIIKPKKVNKK